MTITGLEACNMCGVIDAFRHGQSSAAVNTIAVDECSAEAAASAFCKRSLSEIQRQAKTLCLLSSNPGTINIVRGRVRCPLHFNSRYYTLAPNLSSLRVPYNTALTISQLKREINYIANIQ